MMIRNQNVFKIHNIYVVMTGLVFLLLEIIQGSAEPFFVSVTVILRPFVVDL